MPELSKFAQDIFIRSYAFHPNESWEECALRVAKAVAMSHDQERKFFQIIKDRIFIPGGRYLYTAGRELFQCSNCLPGNSLIQTYNGLKPIKLIKPGDSVLGYDGKYHSVTNKFNNGIKDIVKINTSHGWVFSTPDHRWFTKDHGFVAAENLTPNTILSSVRGQLLPGQQTALPPAKNTTQRVKGRRQASPNQVVVPRLTPDEAWLIGLFQGDGTVSGHRVSIVTKTKAKQDKAILCFKRFGLAPKLRKKGNIVETEVNGYNVAEYFSQFKTSRTTLKVPEEILNAVPEVRAGYLTGIFDSDGSKVAEPLQVAASIYPEFLREIQALYSSLGALTVLKLSSKFDAPGRYPTDKDLWKLQIHKFDLDIVRPFLAPHTTKGVPPTKIPQPPREVIVLSVEPAGSAEVFDITVDEIHEFIVQGLRPHNCFGLFAKDSREGWSQLLYDVTMCLSMGGGVGINFSEIRPSGSPINRMGGTASGPIALMQMVNECARHVMQGGKRRSALWFGLNWKHPDIVEFIKAKDWDENIKSMKAKKFEYPAPLDMANISVIMGNEYLRRLSEEDPVVTKLHEAVCENMLRTGEPAFFNLSRRLQDDPGAITTNACTESTLHPYDTCVAKGELVLTSAGPIPIEEILPGDLVVSFNGINLDLDRVTGSKCMGAKPLVEVIAGSSVLRCTADHKVLVRLNKKNGSAIRTNTCWKEAKDLTAGDQVLTGAYTLLPNLIYKENLVAETLGWMHGDGWLTQNSIGISFNYTDGDEENKNKYLPIFHELFGKRSPLIDNQTSYQEQTDANQAFETASKFGFILATARERQLPRSYWEGDNNFKVAFLRGYFAADGSLRTARATGHKTTVVAFSASLTLLRQISGSLSGFGIRSQVSVIPMEKYEGRNDQYKLEITENDTVVFFQRIGIANQYKEKQFTPSRNYGDLFEEVQAVRQLPGEELVYDLETAFYHNFYVGGMIVHNCNLGSIVLPRIKDLDHLEEVTRLAIQFLYNGSIRATYPLEKTKQVAEINRRLGLGIMGLHEYMVMNNHKYEWFDKLEKTMQTWKEVSEDEGAKYAEYLGGNPPIATRAIAPTGSISIIAEVTSGIEPMFCTAYKRRYINAGKNKYQFVVDPTAKRLVELGISESQLEDAYSLSRDVRRRLEVNAKMQDFVDQAISSTINLPAWGTEVVSVSEFSELMKEYLPRLKGLTTYPENARSGQPLVPVSIHEALNHEGVVFEEIGDCLNGVCGL